MRKLYLCIIFIFLFNACSSTHLIKNDEVSYNKLNQTLKGKKVTLELVNGEEFVGDYVYVKSDSIIVGENKISTKTVMGISDNNHGMGALKGMGYGALSGFILGGVLYLGSMDEPYSEIPLVVLPALGFALGGLFGVVHGDIDEYIFIENSTESKQKVSVEISSIVEETDLYIIISYKDKVIRLNKSEYNSIIERDDGKRIIVIPKSIYLVKFR